MAWEFFGERLVDVLPALGTHKAMSDGEIATMFGKTPRELFRVHDWRNDMVTLGEVPRRVHARGERGEARLHVACAGESSCCAMVATT